jgi:hypothetical protein
MRDADSQKTWLYLLTASAGFLLVIFVDSEGEDVFLL